MPLLLDYYSRVWRKSKGGILGNGKNSKKPLKNITNREKSAGNPCPWSGFMVEYSRDPWRRLRVP
jgi:hypothetical protein